MMHTSSPSVGLPTLSRIHAEASFASSPTVAGSTLPLVLASAVVLSKSSMKSTATISAGTATPPENSANVKMKESSEKDVGVPSPSSSWSAYPRGNTTATPPSTIVTSVTIKTAKQSSTLSISVIPFSTPLGSMVQRRSILTNMETGSISVTMPSAPIFPLFPRRSSPN